MIALIDIEVEKTYWKLSLYSSDSAADTGGGGGGGILPVQLYLWLTGKGFQPSHAKCKHISISKQQQPRPVSPYRRRHHPSSSNHHYINPRTAKNRLLEALLLADDEKGDLNTDGGNGLATGAGLGWVCVRVVGLNDPPRSAAKVFDTVLQRSKFSHHFLPVQPVSNSSATYVARFYDDNHPCFRNLTTEKGDNTDSEEGSEDQSSPPPEVSKTDLNSLTEFIQQQTKIHQAWINSKKAFNDRFGDELKIEIEGRVTHEFLKEIAIKHDLFGGHWAAYYGGRVKDGQKPFMDALVTDWKRLLYAFFVGVFVGKNVCGITWKETEGGSYVTSVYVPKTTTVIRDANPYEDYAVFKAEKLIRLSGVEKLLKFKADVYSACHVIHQRRFLRPTMYQSLYENYQSCISTNFTPDYQPEVKFDESIHYKNRYCRANISDRDYACMDRGFRKLIEVEHSMNCKYCDNNSGL